MSSKKNRNIPEEMETAPQPSQSPANPLLEASDGFKTWPTIGFLGASWGTQVDLFRTYHRTRRSLLGKKAHHCIPEDDMKEYVTGRGAWVWELRNPMILLRPFQVERREGSVSWVKLDEMTMTLVGGGIFGPFPKLIPSYKLLGGFFECGGGH